MVLPINSKNESKLSSVLKKPVICNLQNSNVYKPPIYVLYNLYKNSSGDEIANVNFFYNIAHVEASAYAH